MLKKIILIIVFSSCLVNAQIQYQFTTDQPIYVVGDVHGAYKEIVTALSTVGMIDEDKNWIGGKAHFVSLGDIFDRGPSSRKIIDLYMRLQDQAEQSGGKFHFVLGNHEVMNMTGDLRYLSVFEIEEFAKEETNVMRDKIYQKYFANRYPSDDPKAVLAFNKKYPPGYFYRKAAFTPSGKYGQWLLERPFVIQINDQIFTHGGLSKGIKRQSVSKLNKTLSNSLQTYIQTWELLTSKYLSLYEIPFLERVRHVRKLENSEQKQIYLQVINDLLFTDESPTWYRGNARCHPFFESDNLSKILNRWSAKRLWVGHTPTPNSKVQERLNDQLIIIDTGMLHSYYRGEPWVGKIQKDKPLTFINGLTGKQSDALPSPNRSSPNPYNMSDAELEDFLLTADIIKRETIADGVTKPIKMTLNKGKKSIKALFKFVDTKPGNEKGKWKKDIYDADRFKYEVAAYKLDRIMGIGLVPVSIERTIDGQQGVVVAWINNLVSKGRQKDLGIGYSGFCNYRDQINMMDTFDYLIRNTDRNQSNILYNQDDGQLWFIDHTRSFGLQSTRPRMMEKHKVTVTKEFKKALKSLTLIELNELSPWLHRKQIKAIWKRRKKLIREKF